MKKNRHRKLWIALIAIGLMLPLPVFVGFGSGGDDADKPGVAGVEDNRIVSVTQAQDTPPTDPGDTEDEPTPTSLPQTQVDTSFWIDIPDIDLHHDIKENVNPVNEDEYMDVMEDYVAHGRFTALPPADAGNTYLFAHSMSASGDVTPEGGWFTRIDELEKGDIIYVNYHGNLYIYTVTEREIISPLDTSVYTGNSIYGEHRSLTLQTCYPRGGTELRLMVYAVGE